MRPDSNGFCPQCRGELRSPKRYIIKAQVPNPIQEVDYQRPDQKRIKAFKTILEREKEV